MGSGDSQGGWNRNNRAGTVTGEAVAVGLNDPSIRASLRLAFRIGPVEVITAFDSPWREIIAVTRAVSTPSAKVLRNR